MFAMQDPTVTWAVFGGVVLLCAARRSYVSGRRRGQLEENERLRRLMPIVYPRPPAPVVGARREPDEVVEARAEARVDLLEMGLPADVVDPALFGSAETSAKDLKARVVRALVNR